VSEFVPIRMDRTQAVAVKPGDQGWLRAPQAPIERFPLEREKPESGQVTSLVRYFPDTAFPEHPHPLGEEILVLEGVFSDASGDYPAGSYLRNPPGSRHAPFSKDGCLIFVKLNQFAADDLQTVRVTAAQLSSQPGCQNSRCLLHEHHEARTELIKLSAPERYQHAAKDCEILIIEGAVQDHNGAEFQSRSWLRYPAGQAFELQAVDNKNSLLLVKTGGFL